MKKLHYLKTFEEHSQNNIDQLAIEYAEEQLDAIKRANMVIEDPNVADDINDTNGDWEVRSLLRELEDSIYFIEEKIRSILGEERFSDNMLGWDSQVYEKSSLKSQAQDNLRDTKDKIKILMSHTSPETQARLQNILKELKAINF